MKKIISALAIVCCFAIQSHGQVMDSSLTKKPGHKELTDDTTHSTKIHTDAMPVKKHKQVSDSSMKAMPPGNRKTNQGKPSTGKPQ